MSTPPDFFTADDNEPRRERPHGQAPRGATNSTDEEQRRPAPPVEPDLDRRDPAADGQRRPQLSADTGPQHRVDPGPVGERWQTPPPQDPRRPAPPHSSGPIPQALHSGPIPRLPAPPQSPRYQDYDFGDQGAGIEIVDEQSSALGRAVGAIGHDHCRHVVV